MPLGVSLTGRLFVDINLSCYCRTGFGSGRDAWQLSHCTRIEVFCCLYMCLWSCGRGFIIHAQQFLIETAWQRDNLTTQSILVPQTCIAWLNAVYCADSSVQAKVLIPKSFSKWTGATLPRSKRDLQTGVKRDPKARPTSDLTGYPVSYFLEVKTTHTRTGQCMQLLNIDLRHMVMWRLPTLTTVIVWHVVNSI